MPGRGSSRRTSAPSLQRHGRRHRHHQRNDQQENDRLKIRHVPHGAASRFSCVAPADLSTQWVYTAHSLICINLLLLPFDRMILRPVAVPGDRTQESGGLRRSHPSPEPSLTLGQGSRDHGGALHRHRSHHAPGHQHRDRALDAVGHLVSMAGAAHVVGDAFLVR